MRRVTFEWDVHYAYLGRVTHCDDSLTASSLDEACYIWTRQVTYECVMSHIDDMYTKHTSRRHVTHEHGMSHMNASFPIRMRGTLRITRRSRRSLRGTQTSPTYTSRSLHKFKSDPRPLENALYTTPYIQHKCPVHTSEEPPTLMTATPPANLARRSCSFSFS